MCLIVHRPAAKNGKRLAHLPDSVIESNRRRNSDGFGLGWREGSTLRFEKYGPKEFADFHALLKSLDKQNREYVAHFRMATMGSVNRDMAHPYPYEDPAGQPVLLFHNGVIDIKGNPGESDTYAFVKRVLQKLEPRWWSKDPLRFLVEGSIGWSRLLVMTVKETVHINKSDWKNEGGIWYSTYPMGQMPSYSSSGKDWKQGTEWVSLGDGKGGYYRAGGGQSSDELKVSAITGREPDEGDEDEEYMAGFRSAKDSAAILLPEHASPAWKASTAETLGLVWDKGTGYVKPTNGWLHMGHPVEPISSEGDTQTEQYGQAVCNICKTVGEYYVIDGKDYIDLSHALPEPAEEDPDYLLTTDPDYVADHIH